MADLLQSIQPSNCWGTNELIAFNIKVNTVDAKTFFGDPVLPPLTGVSSVILDNLEEPVGPLERDDMYFFVLMEESRVIRPGEESAVFEFAAFLVEMMRYNGGRCYIRRRKELGFEMCGKYVDVEPDVCIMKASSEGDNCLLIVQEDKRHMQGGDAEPALIADAIAAFYKHKKARQAAGLPILKSKTFAGITMVGTTPTFYKIPITEQLVSSVAAAEYPSQVTTIERFIPPIPFSEGMEKYSIGMVPLSNRRITLQCFEAFRQFINWNPDEKTT